MAFPPVAPPPADVLTEGVLPADVPTEIPTQPDVVAPAPSRSPTPSSGSELSYLSIGETAAPPAETEHVPAPMRPSRDSLPPAHLADEPRSATRSPSPADESRSATRSPSPEDEHPAGAEPEVQVRFGYLASSWLTRESMAGLTERELPDEEQIEARRVSHLPLEEQAQHAATNIVAGRGGLQVDGSAWEMPDDRPPGTRIWLAPQSGNALAAFVLGNGNHRVFNPSANAVETILAHDFPGWVDRVSGDVRHLYVVATPAPPATDDAPPAAAGAGSPPGPSRDTSPELGAPPTGEGSVAEETAPEAFEVEFAGGIVITGAGPQPLSRLANNRVWFTPPEAEELSPRTASFLRGLSVPDGAVLLAVLAPPDQLAPDRVDSWLDQLAEQGQAEQLLVLVFVGADAERSRELARSVQSRIDERLRRSHPAPPGLVASLGYDTDAWAGWWWPSPLGGNTATVRYGQTIPEEQTFPDLPAALAHVQTHPQPRLDVDRALEDEVTGTTNEWFLYPAEVARLVAESLPPAPEYRGDVVLVPVPMPAGPATADLTEAERLLEARAFLRTGQVRVVPADDHQTVPVRLAFVGEPDPEFSSPVWQHYLRMLTVALGNGVSLPATATRPPLRALPLPPTDPSDFPPLARMDLWVNRYARGYEADLIGRGYRDWLEESIPRHAADRIVVEFGSLNDQAIGRRHPVGSALWSRPDRASGEWMSANVYLSRLLRPVDGPPEAPDADIPQPIVVLLGVTNQESDFVFPLRRRGGRSRRDRRPIGSRQADRLPLVAVESRTSTDSRSGARWPRCYGPSSVLPTRTGPRMPYRRCCRSRPAIKRPHPGGWRPCGGGMRTNPERYRAPRLWFRCRSPSCPRHRLVTSSAGWQRTRWSLSAGMPHPGRTSG